MGKNKYPMAFQNNQNREGKGLELWVITFPIETYVEMYELYGPYKHI